MVHSEGMPGESQSKETLPQLYARVFSQLRPRTPLPKIEVTFADFANVNSFIQWKDGHLMVRISDILGGSPPAVHEALAWILLCKLLRKPIPATQSIRYKRFLNKREVVQMVERVRRSRGRKIFLPARGKHYDLIEIFDKLNLEFFF